MNREEWVSSFLNLISIIIFVPATHCLTKHINLSSIKHLSATDTTIIATTANTRKISTAAIVAFPFTSFTLANPVGLDPKSGPGSVPAPAPQPNWGKFKAEKAHHRVATLSATATGFPEFKCPDDAALCLSYYNCDFRQPPPASKQPVALVDTSKTS
ncbi:MAG: hypothetical protein M1836_000966 [Candelina mexicana]|nr:MAG: hypothetical protein M1836_000966 [Candelina mexicana]